MTCKVAVIVLFSKVAKQHRSMGDVQRIASSDQKAPVKSVAVFGETSRVIISDHRDILDAITMSDPDAAEQSTRVLVLGLGRVLPTTPTVTATWCALARLRRHSKTDLTHSWPGPVQISRPRSWSRWIPKRIPG
jgi:hypothetical protein